MRPRFGLTCAAMLLACCSPVFGLSDWSQWRGPGRDGKLVGFRSPAVWPRSLTKKWSLEVGLGHSSPIIVGERAYLFVRRGEKEHTVCLNLTDGKIIWEDSVNAPFDSVIFPAQRLGKSPRSTPLYHEGKLYTIGINGMMTAFDAAKGRVLWRKEFVSTFKIPMPVCGASLSPLVDGKRLYVHIGHDTEGALLALDKDTGKELWSWRGEGPSYTSPILATLGGKRQLITAAHNSWIGLDSDTGSLLWSLNTRQNMFNHNSITPVVSGDLLVCGGNQRPTFALRVKKMGDGWVAEKVWETRDVTLSTSSPLLTGGRVYAASEKRRGQIVCMAPDTGKVLWSDAGDKGEHVTLYDAGPCVLAFTINGDLFVMNKEGNQLKEVARYQVSDGAMWASPAVSGNRLLVKGDKTLTLWEVPAK